MATRNQNIDYVEVLPKCDTCDSLAKYELDIREDNNKCEIYACEDCKANQKDWIVSVRELKVREKKNRY